jgi:hypothetical protein
VNQAILLVDAALRRRREAGAATGAGGEVSAPSAAPAALRRADRRVGAAQVVYAARDRVGMIMLVTLTTLASLVPLAAGTEADSLFGSIALATAGGTIAGTIGALWIVPALLFRRSAPRRRRPPRRRWRPFHRRRPPEPVPAGAVNG